MVKIEERMRLLIISKIQDGDSQRKVSRDLNVCVSTVRKIWNKFQVTSSINDKNRTIRPKNVRLGIRDNCIDRHKRTICQRS